MSTSTLSIIADLSLRASPTGDFGNYIRVSFCYYEVEELVVAVEKVADIVSEVLKGHG